MVMVEELKLNVALKVSLDGHLTISLRGAKGATLSFKMTEATSTMGGALGAIDKKG